MAAIDLQPGASGIFMDQNAITEQRSDDQIREITGAMTEGSDLAYRQFYEMYFDRLYRHLLVLTRGDETLTRDLLQQVLLRVVRYIKAFANERMLCAWLKQVARSCYVDWVRRHAKEPSPVAIELLADDIAASSSEEADESLLSALDASLEQLAPDERELLKILYVDHWPHKKLATAWQTSGKAIESRVARVRQKLKKIILEKLKDYALL